MDEFDYQHLFYSPPNFAQIMNREYLCHLDENTSSLTLGTCIPRKILAIYEENL